MVLVFVRKDLVTDPNGPEDDFLSEDALLESGALSFQRAINSALEKLNKPLDSAFFHHMHVFPHFYNVEGLETLKGIRKLAEEQGFPFRFQHTLYTNKYFDVYRTYPTHLSVGPLPRPEARNILRSICSTYKLPMFLTRSIADLPNYSVNVDSDELSCQKLSQLKLN